MVHTGRRPTAVVAALGLLGFPAAAVLVPALPAYAAAVTCHGVLATVVGTSRSEVIHGTAGRDVIAGLGGDDTILAGAGDDLVCAGYGDDRVFGGAGTDRLYGGSGADRLYGDRGDDRVYGGPDRLHVADEDGTERIGDTVHGGPGTDRLDAGVDSRPADNLVYDVFSWDRSDHGVHIDLRTGTATGEGADTFVGGTYAVVGSSYGDVVEGTDRRDRIYAGPGPDVVDAHGGSDIVVVDTPHRGEGGDADQVWGGDGNDRITAQRGEDRLSGGPGNDAIDDMGAGNDVLFGGEGDDQMYGQLGQADAPQRYDGGTGSDTLALFSSRINHQAAASKGTWDMATGAMTFTLDRPISLAATSIDRAIFMTYGTSWTVTGTAGPDFVAASGTARAAFRGLAGDDVFGGSAGDDVFDGGPGSDHSLGMGAGDDTCISVETVDGSDCEHVS